MFQFSIFCVFDFNMVRWRQWIRVTCFRSVVGSDRLWTRCVVSAADGMWNKEIGPVITVGRKTTYSKIIGIFSVFQFSIFYVSDFNKDTSIYQLLLIW